MEVILDGRFMDSREKVHDILSEKISLPSYYGRNLDALYDVLSEYPEKLNITLVYADVMLDTLGKYGTAVIKTFQDASRENPKIDFSLSNEII